MVIVIYHPLILYHCIQLSIFLSHVPCCHCQQTRRTDTQVTHEPSNETRYQREKATQAFFVDFFFWPVRDSLPISSVRSFKEIL
jgi:hypothetical protein